MNTKILRCVQVLIAVVFFVSVGFTTKAFPQEKKKPVKIGVTIEETGPMGVHGVGLKRGIEAFVKKVNEEGGVLGRPVQAIILDDGSSPAQAVKNVRDLIYTHHVDFIIQGISSASGLAISQVCKTAKVPGFSEGTTIALTLSKGNRYIFRASESSRSQSYGGARYVFRHWPKARKFYILAHDFEFGHRMSHDFWMYLKKFDPKVVLLGKSFVKLNETDFSPYISRVLSAKPDVLFTAWAASTTWIKQAKPAGVFKAFHVIDPGWDLAELVSLPKSDVPTGLVTDGDPWYAIHNAENTAFVNYYKKLYNSAPVSTSYFAYVSAMFGIAAIRKAGTTDKEKVIDALEGLTLDTPVGKVTIRPFDHQSTWPSFLGRVGWSNKYGYAILHDVNRIDVSAALPTKAEVEAARRENN